MIVVFLFNFYFKFKNQINVFIILKMFSKINEGINLFLCM